MDKLKTYFWMIGGGTVALIVIVTASIAGWVTKAQSAEEIASLRAINQAQDGRITRLQDARDRENQNVLDCRVGLNTTMSYLDSAYNELLSIYTNRAFQDVDVEDVKRLLAERKQEVYNLHTDCLSDGENK
jgi:hypothetical protein